jgi:hypothetical protein
MEIARSLTVVRRTPPKSTVGMCSPSLASVETTRRSEEGALATSTYPVRTSALPLRFTAWSTPAVPS